MNSAFTDMLAVYEAQTPSDYLNAAREIVQEVALLGLWRCGFFNQAAFYGGTALRIFHQLRRFSEDLDFTLLQRTSQVRLESVLPSLETELKAWGFTFQASRKSSGDRTGIESAFLKGGTQINLLSIEAPDELTTKFPSNSRIKIKLELDLQPPSGASTEIRTQLQPTPYQVRLYDPPSLFAGKLHALLCRNWKSRIKGRDFYDFVWYVARRIPVNMPHLQARMVQSGHWRTGKLSLGELHERLAERFREADIAQAAAEVRPFLRDARETELWSAGFFTELATKVEC